jgi:hypothetical protein
VHPISSGMELSTVRFYIFSEFLNKDQFDDFSDIAGNSIRPPIVDIEPFNQFLNASDLRRSQLLLSDKPCLLSEQQFLVMKDLISMNVSQMEFGWVRTPALT